MNNREIDSSNSEEIAALALELMDTRGDDRAELLESIAKHGTKRLVVGLLARALDSIDGLLGTASTRPNLKALALRKVIGAMTDDPDMKKQALGDDASVMDVLKLVDVLAEQLAAAWVELSGSDRERTLAELRRQLLRIEAEDEGE